MLNPLLMQLILTHKTVSKLPLFSNSNNLTAFSTFRVQLWLCCRAVLCITVFARDEFDKCWNLVGVKHYTITSAALIHHVTSYSPGKGMDHQLSYTLYWCSASLHPSLFVAFHFFCWYVLISCNVEITWWTLQKSHMPCPKSVHLFINASHPGNLLICWGVLTQQF